MQVVTRAQLAAFLTGSFMDPDQNNQEELTAFGAAILAHSAAPVFVYTDHENGDDPEVSCAVGMPTVDVVPLTYTMAGDSYYGVSVQQPQYPEEGNGWAVYNCYLGGSPLNSAPAFNITAAGYVE